MSNLIGQPGELHFTVQVKRAATGETETYELIGQTEPTEPTEQSTEDNENGSDTLDSGA